jgi:hypothetical protein
MSEMAMPYRFSLIHRQGVSDGCVGCRKQIRSEHLCHTIVVRWMQEINHLDFCQECYDNCIQQYFKAQDFTTSTEQPGFLESLSKLGV